MGNALGLVEELKVLAKRDVLTGLPNTRGFEDAINRRLGEAKPFLLLIADVVTVNEASEDAKERLQALALQMTILAGRAHEVARIGESQFAVLAPLAPHRPTGQLASDFERDLEAEGSRMTSAGPLTRRDKDALGLFRAADERLYARKIIRGEWKPSAASAGLVQQLPERHRAV